MVPPYAQIGLHLTSTSGRRGIERPRRAGGIWLVATALAFATSLPSHAATFVKGVVPDWNQPYWHGASGPNGGPNPGPTPCPAGAGTWRSWCTPTSAANVIGYWEDKRGHGISDGAAAPGSGVAWPNWPAWQDYMANGFNRGAVPAGTADDLGWYLDTDREGDLAQGNGVEGACGAALLHVGTYVKDISRPGLGLKDRKSVV